MMLIIGDDCSGNCYFSSCHSVLYRVCSLRWNNEGRTKLSESLSACVHYLIWLQGINSLWFLLCIHYFCFSSLSASYGHVSWIGTKGYHTCSLNLHLQLRKMGCLKLDPLKVRSPVLKGNVPQALPDHQSWKVSIQWPLCKATTKWISWIWDLEYHDVLDITSPRAATVGSDCKFLLTRMGWF